jgi:hypothetical protein
MIERSFSIGFPTETITEDETNTVNPKLEAYRDLLEPKG